MRTTIRPGIAAFITIVALSLSTGSASALRNIELRGAGAEGRITRSGRLEFNEARLGPESRIFCNVSLLITVSRSIPKIAGTVMGRLTGVAVDRSRTCQVGERYSEFRGISWLTDRGTVGTHTELGAGVLLWDVSRSRTELFEMIYDGFLGTLPSINGIGFHFQRIQFLVKVRVLGMDEECLYEGEFYGLSSIQAENVISTDWSLERTRLTKISGSVFCFERPTLSGRSFSTSPSLTIALL